MCSYRLAPFLKTYPTAKVALSKNGFWKLICQVEINQWSKILVLIKSFHDRYPSNYFLALGTESFWSFINTANWYYIVTRAGAFFRLYPNAVESTMGLDDFWKVMNVDNYDDVMIKKLKYLGEISPNIFQCAVFWKNTTDPQWATYQPRMAKMLIINTNFFNPLQESIWNKVKSCTEESLARAFKRLHDLRDITNGVCKDSDELWEMLMDCDISTWKCVLKRFKLCSKKDQRTSEIWISMKTEFL